MTLLLFIIVFSAAIYFGGHLDLSFLEKEAHSYWVKRGRLFKARLSGVKHKTAVGREDSGGEGGMVLLTSGGVSSSRPVWKYPLSIWVRDDSITGVKLSGHSGFRNLQSPFR